MSFNTVDVTNMVRGEGEWKNMQEVLRRTLKICFDQLERQGEQVAYLAGQVASLKTQLASKPNRDELGDLNQLRAKTLAGSAAATAPSKEYATRADLDKLKERVAHLQADIERKASVRYVDECLQRKVDKSDAVVKNLATFSAAQYASQLKQLYQDVTDTKESVEALSRATGDMQRNMQGAEEFHVVKNQIEGIYRSLGDYYTKNHIQALLDRKQDVAGLDAVLLGKADVSTLQAHNARIEAALEAHEKTITALRLKLNDPSLFDGRQSLARHSAQPLFAQSTSTSAGCQSRKCIHKRRPRTKSGTKTSGAQDGYASSGYDSSASVGSCCCDNAEIGGRVDSSRRSSATARNTASNRRTSAGGGAGEHDMDTVLRDGRIQALIEGLWTKVDNAEVTSQRLKQELEGYRGAMSNIEATLSQVAGATQMETLALVVEEQRRRIDSILTGSLPIESITEEFIRQQADIAEMQSFLSLPQRQPLKQQLHEADELMRVLSDRVAELSTGLGRAGLRLETVEATSRQLETRLQMAEHSREKVNHLHNSIDLTGTEYATVKDIAKRLSGICAVILGQDPAAQTTTAMEAISTKQLPVITRVKSLEADNTRTEQQLRQYESRLRELKQIITTVGFSGASSGFASTSAGSRGDGLGGGGSAYDPPLSTFSQSARSRSGSHSAGASSGVGRFSPQAGGHYPATAAQARSTSPARHGPASTGADHYHHSSTGASAYRSSGMGGVTGGHSPVTPIRSPSPLPSPTRSPSPLRRSAGGSPRRVSFPSAEQQPYPVMDPDAGLDNSRLSVDFEQAMDQVLASINSTQRGEELHVPVQVAPVPPARYGNTSALAMGSTLGSGGLGGLVGGGNTVPGGIGGHQGLTKHTTNLQSVDARLAELKAEKERLRKLLMSRVESL